MIHPRRRWSDLLCASGAVPDAVQSAAAVVHGVPQGPRATGRRGAALPGQPTPHGLRVGRRARARAATVAGRECGRPAGARGAAGAQRPGEASEPEHEASSVGDAQTESGEAAAEGGIGGGSPSPVMPGPWLSYPRDYPYQSTWSFRKLHSSIQTSRDHGRAGRYAPWRASQISVQSEGCHYSRLCVPRANPTLPSVDDEEERWGSLRRCPREEALVPARVECGNG